MINILLNSNLIKISNVFYTFSIFFIKSHMLYENLKSEVMLYDKSKVIENISRFS